MQRMEALETALLKFIELRIAARRLSGSSSILWPSGLPPDIRLKYLLLPSRRGLLPFNGEVELKPKSRSNPANAAWILFPPAATHPLVEATRETMGRCTQEGDGKYHRGLNYVGSKRRRFLILGIFFIMNQIPTSQTKIAI